METVHEKGIITLTPTPRHTQAGKGLWVPGKGWGRLTQRKRWETGEDRGTDRELPTEPQPVPGNEEEGCDS